MIWKTGIFMDYPCNLGKRLPEIFRSWQGEVHQFISTISRRLVTPKWCFFVMGIFPPKKIIGLGSRIWFSKSLDLHGSALRFPCMVSLTTVYHQLRRASQRITESFIWYDIPLIPSSRKLACIMCQVDIFCIYLLGIAVVYPRRTRYISGIIRVAEFYTIDGSIFHASVGLKIPADRSTCQQ